MIYCGWCGAATQPEKCGTCGRAPSLPWTQRNQEAPAVNEREVGRPALDPGQIRQRLRLAIKELGDPSNAELAEYLGISERTLGRWQKVANTRAVTATAPAAG